LKPEAVHSEAIMTRSTDTTPRRERVAGMPAGRAEPARGREFTVVENYLVPALATALGALRVGIQLAYGGVWDAEATFGLLVLMVGLLGIVVELRRARNRPETST
jgi:hypothetical protein